MKMGTVEKWLDTIEELNSTFETATKHLERYLWIREHPAWQSEAFLSGLAPEKFDEAVDAAMAGK